MSAATPRFVVTLEPTLCALAKDRPPARDDLGGHPHGSAAKRDRGGHYGGGGCGAVGMRVFLTE